VEEADADEAVTRILVVTPTPEDAERAALEICDFAQALDLPMAAVGVGWRTLPIEAGIVIAPAGALVETIGESGIKLDNLQSFVVDSASVIFELGAWDAVDELLDLIPRDAQRVIFSPSFPAPVEDTVERRIKKALRYPAEPALPDRAATGPAAGRIAYVVATERDKLELLAQQLRDREPGAAPPIVYCRSDERAAALAEQLAQRGFLVSSPILAGSVRLAPAPPLPAVRPSMCEPTSATSLSPAFPALASVALVR
jgi:ATP-dependent RNA helicase DeaD